MSYTFVKEFSTFIQLGFKQLHITFRSPMDSTARQGETVSGRALSCLLQGWSVTVYFPCAMSNEKDNQIGHKKDILSWHLCSRCGRLFITNKKTFIKMLVLKAKSNVAFCTILDCVINLPLLCLKLCFCMMTVTFYIFSAQF